MKNKLDLKVEKYFGKNRNESFCNECKYTKTEQCNNCTSNWKRLEIK